MEENQIVKEFPMAKQNENPIDAMEIEVKQKSETQNQSQENHEHQLYDPDMIPPNFQIAQDHYKSLMVGKTPDDHSKSQKATYCACCSRRIEREPLGICCNVSDFSYLGAGVPLYFQYIKYSIFILSVFLAASGLYNIISSAISGKSCKEQEEVQKLSKKQQDDICESNWVTSISLGNKIDDDEMLKIQSILNLCTILLAIIALQLFRRSQRVTSIKCDEEDIAANDYAVMIHHIPVDFEAKNDDYDEDLKEFLENNLLPGQKTNIEEINLCYKLKVYYDILDKKKKLIIEKQEALEYFKTKGKYKNDRTIEVIDKEIKAADKEGEECNQKFYEGKGREFMKQYFSGYAFVMFRTETEKDQILDRYVPKSFFQKKNKLNYHGNNLEIGVAPKSSDVFWQNFHVSTSQILRRSIAGSIATILLLGACFGIILGITLLQREEQEKADKESDNNQSTIVRIIAIALGFIIAIINSLLTILINKITELECHRTRTDHNISLAKKLAIAQFINSSLINCLIQTVFYDGDSSNVGVVFSSGGLAYNQNFIFITQAFLPVIMQFIDIPYFIGIFKRNSELKKDKDSILTQSEAQMLFQNPPFDISVKYAAIINCMFTTVFYAPILPQAMIWSIAGLILLYWVQKYTLIKRTTIEFAYGAELSLEMIELLEFVLPIFSAANLFFYIYLDDGSDGITVFTILPICIGVLHAILPMQLFNEKIFKVQEPKPNSEIFEEAKDNHFITDYARENPATSEIARHKYIHSRKASAQEEEIQLQQTNQQQQKEKEKEQDILNQSQNKPGYQVLQQSAGSLTDINVSLESEGIRQVVQHMKINQKSNFQQ